MDDKGNTLVVRGIPKKFTIREIYALQLQMFVHKGCKVFVVYIMDHNEKDNQLKIYNIPILKYFKDIFPEEVLGLPPKRDIDSMIDLVLGVVPTSKHPYWMHIV